MLKRINFRLILAIILLVVYNFFFWKEKLGLNLIIFSILLAGAIIILNSKSLVDRKVLLMLMAVIYSGVMAALHNSFFSKFTVFTSLMLLAGYAHQPGIRALFSSYTSCLLDYCMVPVVFVDVIKRSKEKSRVFRIVFLTIKLAIIPLIIVFIFYFIYAVSNEKFNFYSQKVFNNISDFIFNILKDYSFVRFMFILLGLILLTGVLHGRSLPLIKNLDLLFTEKLIRNKSLKLIWLTNNKKYIPLFRVINIFRRKMNALVSENRIGIILLILVNILLLALNAVDIRFLWLNFDLSEIPVFSDYVYAGTYLLIFSITLSMLILMYFFRGNLNFFRKNKILTYLAYIWIGQNAFMAASVWLRNYYYIIYTHTISYRKTGVIIFVTLTFIGLVTMVLKIRQKRTAYNIFKTNAWAVLAMLLAMSSFNWDINIAEYNLANPKTNDIDIAYLLELSDDVLPALNEKQEMMKRDFYIPRSHRHKTIFAYDYFYERVMLFKKEQSEYTWLSWNYSDHQISEYFKEHQIKRINNENN